MLLECKKQQTQYSLPIFSLSREFEHVYDIDYNYELFLVFFYLLSIQCFIAKKGKYSLVLEEMRSQVSLVFILTCFLANVLFILKINKNEIF
jgi:hypothetical protein